MQDDKKGKLDKLNLNTPTQISTTYDYRAMTFAPCRAVRPTGFHFLYPVLAAGLPIERQRRRPLKKPLLAFEVPYFFDEI